MKQIERHQLMLPEEREKWSRWRKRGRRRFLLFFAGIIVASTLLLCAVFSFVPDFGLAYVFSLLVAGLLGAAPITLVLGNFMWDDMERRFEASRDFFPSEAEQCKIESGIRANLLILVPLAAGGLSVFLPEPYPPLAILWFCSTPFFMIGITLKTGKWWYDRRGPLPVSHPGAIAGMIVCGILGILAEAFWIYILWGAAE